MIRGRNRSSDLPLEAAAAWLARLHADDCNAADRSAFQAWLSAAPENVAAYRQAADAYGIAGELQDMRAALPARSPPSRRAILAGGALAASAAGVAVFAWSRSPSQAYATEIGEQRRIAFDDGAILLLDTDTQVEVRERRDVRAVRLARGRAHMDVSGAGARPAELAVLDWRIATHSGSFDVRCDGADVSVFLIAGEALLNREGGFSQALRAGERVRLSAAGVAADYPDREAATAWQRAQLVLDGQTLASAIAEMNRYSRTALHVEDEATANLLISGVYRVGDNAAFARSVSVLLPVTPQVRGDAIVLAPAPQNSSPGGG